jgi:hypothetical protein
MKNTYKFIEHVIGNLFPLNEYSDGEMKRLMEKFKEEADDLGIEISDEQLKKYIERFDQLKGSPKVEDKEIRRWPLSKLIKLVSSSEGADSEEEEGPDVLYSGDGYTVYSGGNEELCQRHRNEVPWCITRNSFGNYRYNAGKEYPSFYLIKNTNLPESNKLSFVAIQVRNDDESRRYVWTPRDNDPNESSRMGWSKLTSDIPWLNEIPNIRNILKNIPLSSKEKATQVYNKPGSEISIRQWVSMPFNEKKQYLVVRNGKTIFSDITNEQFIADYLPKYPQLAAFAATTPGVIQPLLLLKNLDKFSANDRKSITANLHNLVDTKELSKDILPFDVKKLLTALNKWNIKNNEKMYVTKNGEAIVKLTFDDELKLGVFTAEDDYPNVKVNKRTAKFLLDYPKIDEIPFNNLIKLASDDVIDKDFITKVIQKAEQDPNSAIVVKDTENGKILLDSNSFTSYKIEGDKISPISFSSDEVQNILASETENSGFQKSAVDLVFTKENIPTQIDKDSFLSILKNTPYDKRTKDGQVILPLENGIVAFNTDASQGSPYSFSYGVGSPSWNIYSRYSIDINSNIWREYFNYLRNKNFSYTDDQLMRVLSNLSSRKKAFIEALPPMAANSIYKPAVFNDTSYLVNTVNPRDSKMISNTSGKIVKGALSSSQASTALGTTVQVPAGQAQAAPATAQAGATRRGRPAGVPGAPRPAAAPAAGALETSRLMSARGLETAFNGLPRAVRARLATAVEETGLSRGASRRNNQLGNRGRVAATYNSGPSSIYFITLANGSRIASINIQPGNGNYVLIPGQEYVRLNSPTELLSALQARELAEVFIAEFMSSNPTMIDETRKIVKFYNRKIKNKPNMKLNELKNLIKNEIRAILAEGATETETAPTKKEKEKITTKPKHNPLKPRTPDTQPDNRPFKAQTPQKEGMSKGISDIIEKYKLLTRNK